MQLRKKILSYFLFILYLLVVLHHNVSHSPTLAFSSTPGSEPSHQHEHFEDIHHDHHFHVGIFHFLGHLFESIDHSNDLADEHLIVVQKAGTKKVVDHTNVNPAYLVRNSDIVVEVDAESLPDPPYHLQVLHKLKLPNTPLRAPPSLV